MYRIQSRDRFSCKTSYETKLVHYTKTFELTEVKTQDFGMLHFVNW